MGRKSRSSIHVTKSSAETRRGWKESACALALKTLRRDAPEKFGELKGYASEGLCQWWFKSTGGRGSLRSVPGRRRRLIFKQRS